MYPLPTLEINFVTESTGHDPRQFLIRRCISQKRKVLAGERRVERERIRETARYNRSSANIQRVRKGHDSYIRNALRRQYTRKTQFRTRTNSLDPDSFRESRRSRRAIIREAEGLDRINAIRRNTRAKNLPDPCASVGAIRQFNNPCRDYGSDGRIR